MKDLFIIIALINLHYSLLSQSDSSEILGSISYIEGTAEMRQYDWVSIKLKDTVRANMYIRTHTNSVVEILWFNGTKTMVEPSSDYLVSDLLSDPKKINLNNTESIFTRFQKMFGMGESKRVNEEAGVRRSQVKVNHVPGPEEMYWMEDDLISFESALSLYEKKEHAAAAYSFKKYIGQHPSSERVGDALFLGAHCYLKLNNFSAAKNFLEKFVSKYPSHAMIGDVLPILDKLQRGP